MFGGEVTILSGTATLSPDREYSSFSLAVHPAAVAEPLVVMSALEAAMTFAHDRLGGELRFGELTGPDALPSARATLVRDVARLRAAGVEPGSRAAYDLFGLDGRLRPDVPFAPLPSGSGEP